MLHTDEDEIAVTGLDWDYPRKEAGYDPNRL